ncbi:MAG TPA: polysaccharide biosynthesis tyrosine autokinase [Acidimicrobiales bacterium]|nr:polysaccharide biosynthesis tyrosine autokinase [Acidimicrobiales bacterium]
MDPTTDIGPVDLKGYLRILRRRKWWVIVCTLVGVVGGLAYGLTAPKEYSATAQLLVQPQNGSVSLGASQPTITPTDVATELQLLGSAPVVNAVKARLHLSQLTAKSAEVGQTDVISLTATDRRAEQAARIANTYADQFVAYETSLAAKSLVTAELQLEGQINAVTAEIPTAATPAQATALANQQAVLKEEYAQLQVDGAETSGGVEVTSAASVPSGPSSPKKGEIAGLGLGLGLLIGLIAAFVVEALDDAIYSTDDLERAAPHVPVMAMIPVVGSWRDRNTPLVATLVEPTSPVSEAYRSLRTALQFAAENKAIGSVLVTSPTAAEGKSSTASNLGVVLAKVGLRVVLVSADLRRPRLASFFGLDEGTGMTSVMIGEATLDDAIQPVPQVPGLSVLGCGPRPPDPAEVLSSPKVATIFTDLATRFDMIVVDSPPLLPVTDPLLLGALTDMTLLVVAAGQTKKSQLQRTRERLAQTGIRPLGIVFNEVKRDTDDGYGYSYSYTAASDETQPTAMASSNGHSPSRSGERAADERWADEATVPPSERADAGSVPDADAPMG